MIEAALTAFHVKLFNAILTQNYPFMCQKINELFNRFTVSYLSWASKR